MLYSLDFNRNKNVGSCFMISYKNILCNINDIHDFSWCDRVDLSEYSNSSERYVFIKCNCLRHKMRMLSDLRCLNINAIEVFDSSKYNRLIKIYKCHRVTNYFKLDNINR